MPPVIRPRRLRTTPAMRRLVAETSLEPRHLVLPMFVADGIDDPRPIGSMPGVVQHSRSSLQRAAAEAAERGAVLAPPTASRLVREGAPPPEPWPREARRPSGRE